MHFGTPWGQTVTLDSKNNRFNGYGGDDIVYGKAGNDRLWGETGDDTLYGGVGHDKIYGDQANDTLYGGAGDDELHGGFGNDLLKGGLGADALNGGYGEDIIYADLDDIKGNKNIYGGLGFDSLILPREEFNGYTTQLGLRNEIHLYDTSRKIVENVNGFESIIFE